MTLTAKIANVMENLDRVPENSEGLIQPASLP
jgi:hypothetical protein